MNGQQTGGQVAQPAREEIKKHGDQLQKQVDEAAGKTGRGGQPGEQRQEGDRPS